MTNYDRAPLHAIKSIKLYVEQGVEPGGFLYAVLSNDFVGAFSKADEYNIQCLMDYATWLYCDAPMACWGSKDKVRKWIDMGGHNGYILSRSLKNDAEEAPND